ncbi:MSMEG_1061 family FMN-dependent PPOX-type flavoprotein [Litorivivens sp.]|uniref:MSMEG_1061 family FMN-dependent PPOX-type flavoprotein n=1 Tax=Litorivivens sp. TaxID=2020868 RepID=UPI00356867BC
MQRIESERALRELLGQPHDLVKQKISEALTEEALDFIGKSPLLFLATTGIGGNVTVSPKGDADGFVRVVDNRTLIIPERPGNKLLHGLINILETGSIGLLFIVPGTEETLRVNGKARLYQDEDLCKEMAANGKSALLLIQVEVTECFFHCAKAFKRSKAWQSESWRDPLKINFGKQIARNAAHGRVGRAAIAMAVDAAVKADYKKNL